MSVNNVTASTYYRWETGWNSSWYNCRRETPGSGTQNDTVKTMVTRDNPGNNYKIARGTAVFDTSAIPASSTIHSLVYHWWRGYERNQQNSDAKTYVCPVDATGTAGSYFYLTHFGTQVGYITNYYSYDINGGGNPSAWADVTLNSSCIVKAGSTILGFRMGHDYNGDADVPGNVNDKANEMSNEYFPTNQHRDYLTITWTTAPAVTTGTATALQPISATLAGNVTDAAGGTVSTRGVCWATTANPTTASSKTATTGTTGAFTVAATGLLPGTLYHYRAYVTTENSTTYGADTTFRTPGGAILFNLL